MGEGEVGEKGDKVAPLNTQSNSKDNIATSANMRGRIVANAGAVSGERERKEGWDFPIKERRMMYFFI